MTHSNPADWALFDDVKATIGALGGGADLDFTPPLNRDFEIALFKLDYHADITVADRYIRLTATVDATEVTLATTTTPITTLQTWSISFLQNVSPSVNPVTFHMIIPLPQRLRLSPNSHVYIRLTNPGGFDNMQLIRYGFNMQIKTNI